MEYFLLNKNNFNLQTRKTQKHFDSATFTPTDSPIGQQKSGV
jgi:hypothetical protein